MRSHMLPIVVSLLSSRWRDRRHCAPMRTKKKGDKVTHLRADALARAVSGSCSARTNSGPGHGKWGDGSAELLSLALSVQNVSLFTHMCVGLSVKRTDWLSVDPSAVCMICPILYPATLCKQQLSVNHGQEVRGEHTMPKRGRQTQLCDWNLKIKEL